MLRRGQAMVDAQFGAQLIELVLTSGGPFAHSEKGSVNSLPLAIVSRTDGVITVVTRGTPAVIAQIKAQLQRLVPVHEVHDLTAEGPAVQRELALFKVAGRGDARIEALRLAEIFRANVVDSTLESFVFEMTGTSEKIDAFTELMRPLGLREIARTGIAALSRGA